MQRVGSGLPKGSQVASRSPSTARTGQKNQVATLRVQRLGDDVSAVRSNVHVEDSFKMKMDAQGFNPEELVVQVDGQCLTVTGQRQKESYGSDGSGYRMEQTLHRQMLLPPNLDPAGLTCCLTPSGQLCIRGQCGALLSAEAQTGHSSKLKSHRSKGSNLA
ncbi:heat shock protein beta-9 [Myotis daubentonii]|uniref:heat shock protein beta-9 n=1 Tax=Myotis daubentonii TaxID=98922 RepID=UPI002872E560|nr:heat shock protein beta-9 [Myotis daubentonii]